MVGASGGASKSSSSSNSESYGYNVGERFAQTGVWGAQSPYLQQLYGDTSALAAKQAGTVGDTAQGLIDPLQAQGNQFLSGMAGLADSRGQIQAQSDSLRAGLGQLFSEQINPAITSSAVAAGGLGGGRQGVAQGVAAGQLGQAYTQGLGDITARANAQALGAQQAGIGALPQLYNLGMQGYAAQWAPYQQQAGLLGGPTVLSQDYGYSAAEDFASSQAKSKSSAFNFGLSVG